MVKNIWLFIEPDSVNPSLFGFRKILALKMKRHSGQRDVRATRLKGWELFADLQEYDPASGQYLGRSVWFVYAAKGY